MATVDIRLRGLSEDLDTTVSLLKDVAGLEVIAVSPPRPLRGEDQRLHRYLTVTVADH